MSNDRNSHDAPTRPRADADAAPATQRSPSSRPEGSEPSLVGQVIADRYLVHGLLGTGGMGSVYRGEHIHMRNAVAIKVLHPELLLVPEIVARFEREAIASARINDAHVVNATDFGRLEDGSFYLVLEYVQGRSLGTVVERGPLDQVRALKIARQIAQALVTAHAEGIIHRDLKPENVMLVERPDDPDFVKVLDFGIAKVMMSDRPSLAPHAPVLTQLGTVFGTPDYMAPEQAEGSEVDHRVDLYTVGIMLYEMLTGTAPFHHEDVAKVLLMQMQAEPPPLPEYLNRSLVTLVMTQLSKVPAERSQTAEELLAWIDDVLVEFSVVAPLPEAAFEPDVRGSAPDEAPPAAAGDESANATGGLHVPWFVLASSIVVFGLLATLAGGGLWLLSRDDEAPAVNPGSASAPVAARSASSATVDPQRAQLLARAATGDKAAIKAVEARPAAERNVQEWVALARGRMRLGRHKSALEAYTKALDGDPSLEEDRILLGHVSKAARSEETAEEALRLAALRLGTDGADLLYHVWVSTREKTSTTQLAKQLVYSDDVRAKASPALAIALDLRLDESCEHIKQLLPRATLHGDVRTYRVLQPLAVQRGCGAGKREDCYPCLREGTVLTDAIAAARVRSEPSFVAR